MAYTDQAAIEAYLQRPLEATEAAALPAFLSAATRLVDRQTGRSFGPVVVTGELHRVDGPLVYLRRRPVASIEALSLRPLVAGSSGQVLQVGHNYELLDPANGKVTIAAWWDPIEDFVPAIWQGWQLSASYTVSAPVPDDIALATTMIVARWLTAPDDERVAEVSVDGVTYRVVPESDIPAAARTLLAGNRKLVFA